MDNFNWNLPTPVLPQRGGGFNSTMGFSNWFTMEHVRDGEVIGTYKFPNGVVNEGKNHALDVTFLSATTQEIWYLSLITGTGTLADTDTMASHPGWDEFTSYTNATRWPWGPESAVGQGISNSVTSVDFSITGSGTVKGAFLTSNNVKAGTTGILFATALNTPEIVVTNGDTLRLTYSVNLT